MQPEEHIYVDVPPLAQRRYLTIEEVMAHTHIKSRSTLKKYVQRLNISLKRPGIGSKRLYMTWDDAERVRQLQENPLMLDELKHLPDRKGTNITEPARRTP